VPPEPLSELISRLAPEEQSAVREFIQFLRARQREAGTGAFLSAVEEFIAAHPELLRRLAQ
jgi:hypothetical protein